MEALFEIGQKVVCVDSNDRMPSKPSWASVPLVEGKTYTVLGLSPCRCGTVSVDVGLRDSEVCNSICTKCGAVVTTTIILWADQTRFVPLDFDRQADEAIHEALKGHKTLTN